jgi:RNA polymerase sigma factor (sigma-70 family)
MVAAVRAGDDFAFERLYRRYQRRIGAYIYGMVHDHGRAEDITQDVFMSALRRMRATDTEIAFKPWIYEIAKNACIDAFRRSKRAEEISYDADEGGERLHLVSNGPTPDAAVDTRMALDHLRGAFGGLSEAHHQILVMRELEGLSYRQIGEQLGMTRASVESTLFRARRRLTEEYEELVSGERCKRIQGIIAGANGGRVGVRDERKMARHVSYCQPCRRAALAAGFDPASLERRRSVREKIAALLPLPAVLRRWVAGGSGGGEHGALWSAAAHYAEPAGGGWVKAAAAAAALVVAGVGVDAVAPHGGGSAPEQRAHASAPVVHTSPAALRDAADRLAGSPTTSSTQARNPASSGTHIKKKKHGGSSASSVHSSAPTPSGSAPSRPAPAGGGSSSAPSSSSPSSSSPSRPSSGGDDPVSKTTRSVTDKLPTGSGSGSAAPSAPAPQVPTVKLPTVQVPSVPGAPPPVNDAVGAVNDAASTVTGAVNDTTGAATDTVNDTVGKVTGTVNGAGKAVGDTVNTVTGGGILGGG